MHHKKRTTEEYDQWLDWDQDTYQTGSTRPPKSHGGLIAFLLGLVIFLSGISTVLGLMNIQLFRQLNELEEPTSPLPDPVRYSRLGDVTSEVYLRTLNKLIEKGYLLGRGGEGSDRIVDLTEDSVRLLVILDRAGVFGD